MAKKLLSLLCAVTLIVSMVTIIATTVTATAEDTTVKLFSDNPTLSTSDTNHHGVLAPTYAPDSNYGFDTVLTTMYMRTVLWSDKTQAVDDNVSLTLGKYTLRMIHSAADISGETTSNRSNFLVCGQNAACDLTAEIGTYAIDSYFKLNFTLYGKNATPKESSGVNGDNESWIVTVGDFQFTVTRAAYDTNIDNTANQHTVVLKKVTYKGSELPIVGDTVYTKLQAYESAHNSTETLTANAEYRAYCDNEFIDYSWMLKEGQYFWPTFHHNMEIVYDRGVITITNLGNPDKINIGGGPVVAQVDATKVVDTTKELGASRVAFTAKGTRLAAPTLPSSVTTPASTKPAPPMSAAAAAATAAAAPSRPATLAPSPWPWPS